MDIQHQDDGHNGRFYIETNHTPIAELTYVWSGNTAFTIDHTFVDGSLRGQGVAKHLLDAAVAFARRKNARIVPLCSYARVMFERDPAYRDVI